jgi:hypothetical protein
MKVHGDPTSPHYYRLFFEACPKIMLDGQLLDHVVEADDVEGAVIVERRWADGRLARTTSGKFATKRLTGKVEILGRRLRVGAA